MVDATNTKKRLAKWEQLDATTWQFTAGRLKLELVSNQELTLFWAEFQGEHRQLMATDADGARFETECWLLDIITTTMLCLRR